MRKIKKALAMLLALCMIVALAACGSTGGGATTAAATTTAAIETATEEATNPHDAIEAGSYSFTYTDEYGDTTSFTVTLKDTGIAYIQIDGALGSKNFKAESWEDTGLGSFITSALDDELKVNFLGDDGTIEWIREGDTVWPAGYTEPTTFLEKEKKAPESKEEAVGVYTFGWENPYGKVSPYIFWVNSDGTWYMFQPNTFMGTAFAYSGESWDYDPATCTLSLGPCTTYAEGEPPKTAGNGADFFSEGTYESSYVLDGNGVKEIVGAEAKTKNLYTKPGVGLFFFGWQNPYGNTSPYFLLTTEEGAYYLYQPNQFMGRVFSYSGEKYEFDETTSILALGEVTKYEEGEPPMTAGNGADWFAEGTYESSYIVNDDHSLIAIGAEDKMVDIAK